MTTALALRGADDPSLANQTLDKLGLYTAEVYQRGLDAIIARQQQEVLELSTPVVTLWDGILALPLIGTLDSARTQVVMETLLQRIVDSGPRPPPNSGTHVQAAPRPLADARRHTEPPGKRVVLGALQGRRSPGDRAGASV